MTNKVTVDPTPERPDKDDTYYDTNTGLKPVFGKSDLPVPREPAPLSGRGVERVDRWQPTG